MADKFPFADSSDFFNDATFRFYCNGKKDMEADKYLSAVVWSAVFVESLLKDVLKELGVNAQDLMLNALIEKTTSCMGKDSLVEKDDRDRFKTILDNCDTIRKNRNSLLHSGRRPKDDVIETKAKSIYDDLLYTILDEYTQTRMAMNTAAKKQQTAGKEQQVQPYFPVFVSTVTPFTFEQAVFVEGFCTRLKEIGVIPVRCLQDDFGTQNPIELIRERVSQCHALVVIGLEKYYVYHYAELRDTAKQKEYTQKAFTSEWLQLESGIAYGMGKKIFAMHQHGLHNKGIFGRSVASVELDEELNVRSHKVDSVIRDIELFAKNFKG